MGWAGEHLSEGQREEIARSLFEVATRDGDWLNGRCPFHQDENPSFGYNVVEDVFKCLANCAGSGGGGDLIKMFCLINGYEDSEGFKLFQELHGDGADVPLAPPNANQQKKKEDSVIDEDIFQQMPILDEGWSKAFLDVRGWRPEIVKSLDIRIQNCYRDAKTGDIVFLKPGQSQRVAMPIRGLSGKLHNLRLYRRPGAKVQNKIISWGKGYGRARLFPNINQIGKDGPLLLCEGEPDTICAMSYGFSAATLTANNVKNWPGELLAPFRNRDVIICYDADMAGQTAAKEMAAKNVLKVAKSVRILQWPDSMGKNDRGMWPEDHGKDLTDFFIEFEKTAKDLQELFATAETVEKPKDEEPRSSASQFWKFNPETKRRSFKPRLLAEQLIKDRPLLYEDETGQLFCWNGQYWELFSDGHLKRMAIKYLGDESLQNRVNDAAFQAKILSIIPHGRTLNDRTDWVCVKNGMLNIGAESGTLKPHNQDYLASVQLGVEYNPQSKARCEKWLKFLAMTIKTPEVIAQVQEYFGYCLTRDVRYSKCLMLHGPGEDGKSVLLKILKALVGEANTSAVQFKDLEDQFQRVAIYSKMLNISTEVGSGALESAMFKAIVSGDPIQASFKHRDAFMFQPYVKLAFATNKLPRVLDNSHGFFRRILLVTFKRQFLEGDPDRNENLEDELMEELSEIFLWALAGLQRLRKQGRFTACDETLENLKEFQLSNNPVKYFVETKCVIDAEKSVSKDDLFDAYVEFCKAGKFKPLNKSNFHRELKGVVNVREFRPSVGDRKRRYGGLALEEGFNEVTE